MMNRRNFSKYLLLTAVKSFSWIKQKRLSPRGLYRHPVKRFSSFLFLLFEEKMTLSELCDHAVTIDWAEDIAEDNTATEISAQMTFSENDDDDRINELRQRTFL